MNKRLRVRFNMIDQAILNSEIFGDRKDILIDCLFVTRIYASTGSQGYAHPLT